MADDIPEVIDTPAEEVPTPITPEHVPPHEPEHHDDIRPAFVDEIIDAINSVKEASPITPPQEEVLDKTPVKAPWTHRKLFGKGRE